MATTTNSTKTKSAPKKNAQSKTPKYGEEQYLKWFHDMLLIRRFEEKAGQLYGQQKIRGFCHLYMGQEACAVGAASALRHEDKWITAYRDHGQPLALGVDASKVMAELFAKETGISKGKGGSMHMFDKSVNLLGGHGIVGGQIPLGTGIAFAEKYKKTDNLCVCFLGDGAVRQGAFHESLNMAMTWKLPVVYVIENNFYGMGTAVERVSNVTDLYKLGSAYEMPAFPVDGMTVETVHEAIEEAAERARKGEGPTLLEVRTYRYKGHSMSDPAKYRTREELNEYKNADPIGKARQALLDNQWKTEDEVKEMEAQVKQEVEDAVQYAEESPLPDPKETYIDVYTQEDYPYIIE